MIGSDIMYIGTGQIIVYAITAFFNGYILPRFFA